MPYKYKLSMAFTDFSEIWRIIHNDLYLINLESDKRELDRRNYIKNLISLVEGLSYSLRRLLLNNKKDILTIEEQYVLNEFQFNVSDNGTLKVLKKRYPSYNLFKLTFKIYGKCYGKESIIEKGFSDNKLNNLKNTFSKRNSLTHPKKREDLIVTEAQYKEAVDAYDWLYKFFLACFDEIFIEKIT
jgi:hypothetical protein